MTSAIVLLRSSLDRASKTKLKPGEYAIGVDVGGTKVCLIMINNLGCAVCKPLSLPIPVREGPRLCLEIIAAAVTGLLNTLSIAREAVVVCGLDSPGPSSKDGVLYKSPNLDHPDWIDFPLRDELQRAINIRCVYANDGDIAAWLDDHDLFNGAQAVQHSTLGCYIGTGFGGGAVFDGELWQGKTGASAEFGHIPVIVDADIIDPVIPTCGCGSKGCVEAYVSLTALDRQLRLAIRRLKGEIVVGSVGGGGSPPSPHPTLWEEAVAGEAHKAFEVIPDEGTERAKLILRLAGEGNPLAKLLLHKQAAVLGKFLAGLVCFNEPDYVVVGGGILTAVRDVRDQYLATVKAAFVTEAFGVHATHCEVRFSTFEDAAAYGSALRAAMTYEHPAAV